MKNNEVNYIGVYKDKKYRERGLILSFPKVFFNVLKTETIVIKFSKDHISIREATILDYKSNRITKNKGSASTYIATNDAEFYTGKYKFEKDGDIIYLTKII